MPTRQTRTIPLGLLAASLILIDGCGWKVTSRTNVSMKIGGRKLAFKKGSLELDGKELVSTGL